MKAGIYTRVSTDMQVQRGESLDEQFDEARLYCKYKGVPIVDIYREEGKSAKNTDRPELQRLLRDCKKGKIDAVIVKKLDRLSRSTLRRCSGSLKRTEWPSFPLKRGQVERD